MITNDLASLFSLVLRMEGVITGGFAGALVISGFAFVIESTLAVTGGSFTFFLAVPVFGFLPAGGFDLGIVVFFVTGGGVSGFSFTTGGAVFFLGSNFFGVGRKEGSM